MGQKRQNAFSERLTRPDNLYIPKGQKKRSLLEWVQLRWFQVQITFGTYAFDWWERLLVHTFLLLIVLLVLFGIYEQIRLLISLVHWWSQYIMSALEVSKLPT